MMCKAIQASERTSGPSQTDVGWYRRELAELGVLEQEVRCTQRSRLPRRSGTMGETLVRRQYRCLGRSYCFV